MNRITRPIVIQPWPKSFTLLSMEANDGSELLAILSDGTVRGTIENAGPAAQRFMTELRGMTEAVAAQAKAEALAEIEAKHSNELDEVMRERDEREEWADRLAYAIAPMEVIGEHSSGNNPWKNALDYLP